MSVTHSFSVEVACLVGDRAATILNNFGHWHLKNGADNRNVIDGYVWTYNSITAYAKVWPYLTVKQIRVCLENMEKEGYLKTGNHNEWRTDKTKWYALTEKACELLKIPFSVELADLPKKANAFAQKGKTNCPEGQTDLPEMADGFAQKGEPIPDIKPITDQLENQQQNPDEATAVDADFEFAKKKINEVRQEVLHAQILKDQACMNLKIKQPHYDQLVNAFFDEQIAFAQAKETILYNGLRKHLTNWIKVQVRIGTESSYHPNFKPVAPVNGFTPRNGHAVEPSISARFTSPVPD